MAEEKYKINTYAIDYKCDVCGKGWYRPIGIVCTTNPLTYPHKCDHCGAKAEFRVLYPRVVTERVKK